MNCFGFALLHSVIGSKFSRHFFKQSQVKPKVIVARACTFSRALCWLRVITLSFDWFTGLSPSFLVGQSNYWFYDTRLKLAVKAWPNARNIFNFFYATFQCLCALGPWRATSGSNAHALAQQCCVNVKRERGQTSTTSCNIQNVARKTWPFSNLIQHIATYRNRLAKRTQYVAPKNVASVWPGLKLLRLWREVLKPYSILPN